MSESHDSNPTTGFSFNSKATALPPAATARYTLGDEIARGGMGIIYQATDAVLGREVAVKVLQEKYGAESGVAGRFSGEARITSQLQHPSIPPIHDFGTLADGRPFLAMKLIKGQTLEELLKARTDASVEQGRFVAVFEQICQALGYAHSHDVIHRDLKPANVMVGAFGEVQVMDWGLAKVQGGETPASPTKMPNEETRAWTQISPTPDVGSHTQAGSLLGTPAFAPPEQALGEIERVDSRADVFGLGAILAVILTGKPPYVGETAESVRVMAVRGKLDDCFVRLTACGAEPELVALCKRCLAFEPADRPADGGAVAKAVAALRVAADERARRAELERVRAEGEQATAIARAVEERRRRGVQLVLAASVLAFTAVGGLSVMYYLQQRAEQAAAIDRAVGQVVTLRDLAKASPEDLARWHVALAAVEQVEAAQDQRAAPRLAVLKEEIQAGLEAAQRDQVLLDRLVDIRSAEADDRNGSITDRAYAAAFLEAGIDVAVLSPAEAGVKIRARPAAVAVAMAAALDDWATVRREWRHDRAGAGRLAQAARAADPDTWRGGLRDALDLPEKPQRLNALQVLARAASFDELPPVSLGLLGTALRDAGDAQASERVLRQAQLRYPADLVLNYELAASLAKLARREEAIRYYTAARSIRPEIAHELAHALEFKGELDEGIAIFQDLARRRPDNGRHLICLAQLLQRSGRNREATDAFDAAIAVLREQIRKSPTDDVAHLGLGRACRAQGKLDESIGEFREAIRLRPDDAQAHTQLGESLSEQGNLEEAVIEFHEAIRIKADDRAHAALAYALERQGKLEEAVAEYRTAIRLQPDIHQSHENLGIVLHLQAKLEEAVAEFRIALRIDPTCHNAHRLLGDTLRDQEKLDEAVVEYREALRHKPDDTNSLYDLCKILKQLGKHEQVVAVYSDVVARRPESAVGHNGVAWELALDPKRPQQTYQAALTHSHKAVELDPKDANNVNTLALVEYRIGHWAESITACERSMALGNGGNGGDWFFLAMALAQKGEKDKAGGWFQKAVAWTKEKDPKNVELRQFWAEAAELLGQRGPDVLRK